MILRFRPKRQKERERERKREGERERERGWEGGRERERETDSGREWERSRPHTFKRNFRDRAVGNRRWSLTSLHHLSMLSGHIAAFAKRSAIVAHCDPPLTAWPPPDLVNLSPAPQKEVPRYLTPLASFMTRVDRWTLALPMTQHYGLETGAHQVWFWWTRLMSAWSRVVLPSDK